MKLEKKGLLIFLSFLFLLTFSVNAISKTNKDEIIKIKHDSTDIFSGMKFRNIGPAVAGGRVSSVAGIPGKPNIYYIGAASGGIFKTTDGGHSWKAIFTKYPLLL